MPPALLVREEPWLHAIGQIVAHRGNLWRTFVVVAELAIAACAGAAPPRASLSNRGGVVVVDAGPEDLCAIGEVATPVCCRRYVSCEWWSPPPWSDEEPFCVCATGW